MQPPAIDERDRYALARQLNGLLERSGGRRLEPKETEIADAVIQVFARYGELLIERINRAPHKNFLAFLEMLGVSKLPPRPAVVPLTFYLAPSAGPAIVPARTQVATQPLPGEKDPVIFETLAELEVVPIPLNAMFAKNGGEDVYGDLSGLLPQAMPKPGTVGALPEIAHPVFRGDAQIPHRLYLGLEVTAPSFPIDRLSFDFVVNPGLGSAAARGAIEWKLYILPPPKKDAVPASAAPLSLPPDSVLLPLTPMSPVEDNTNNLSKSGKVVFLDVSGAPQSQAPPGAAPAPQPPAPQPLHMWLTATLVKPILSGANAGAKALKPDDLPRIQKIEAAQEIARDNIAIRNAFLNGLKLDLTKDFYPFGERPTFGDTLYLESPDLFSNENSEVTLTLEMTNAANVGARPPLAAVAPRGIVIAWEYWNGAVWRYLGSSSSDVAGSSNPSGDAFQDTTEGFSVSGQVTVRFPAPPAVTAINGVKGYWIRARIVEGVYGYDAPRTLPGGGTEFRFAPPVFRQINGAYRLHEQFPVQLMFAQNDFAVKPFMPGTSDRARPFVPVGEARPALYLGFEAPAETNPELPKAPQPPGGNLARISSRSMNIYLDVEQRLKGISTEDAGATAGLQWEYWSGSGWARLGVKDETGGFRHPGLVSFIVPDDPATASRFGLNRYWMRASTSAADLDPQIRLALANTVLAESATSVTNEVLGVSNGTPDQSFRFMHTPVLPGQLIEVLEPRKHLQTEEPVYGAGATPAPLRPDTANAPDGSIWIEWREVPDFYASLPRDRHYVLDRLTGVVTFGDGQTGMAPPRGSKVRALRYRCGGGAAGNRPLWNITQLKSAVPYIAAACNWVESGGGGDPETDEALLERGSRGIRHGGRAVTAQDYEDAARLAWPQVARAKCVPLRDLAAHPSGKRREPGVVSVVVVPRSEDPQPSPGSQLLETVLGYLRSISPPTARISVVPPEFVRVNVTAEIVLRDPERAAETEHAVKEALERFLHPLTGGAHGSGWDFGRRPHRADLFALIQGIPGVEFVRDVRAFQVSQREDVELSEYFLVSAGEFTIECSLGFEGGAA